MTSPFERIHRLRQPVIAAVNGPASGAGFALSFACDIRYASPDATFGAVYATLGAAIDKAHEIARNSPLAVWLTKKTMWLNVDAPGLRHALDLENRTQVTCTATGRRRHPDRRSAGKPDDCLVLRSRRARRTTAAPS